MNTRTINRRSLVIGSAFAFIGAAGGHLRSASAQDVAAVEAFVQQYFQMLNARDPAVVSLTTQVGIFGGAQAPDQAIAWLQNPDQFVGSTLHLVQNVAPAGEHVSVEVAYSGWSETAPYYTERWYLQPQPSGGYIVTGGELVSPPFYPADWQVANLTVNYDWVQLALDGETELTSNVNVVAITANTGVDVPLTSGLYELPEGASVLDVQAQLLSGNLEPVPYLGPLYDEPGEPNPVYNFLVEPGKVYAFIGFYLDANNNFALTPFTEEAFTATFTVAPEGK